MQLDEPNKGKIMTTENIITKELINYAMDPSKNMSKLEYFTAIVMAELMSSDCPTDVMPDVAITTALQTLSELKAQSDKASSGQVSQSDIRWHPIETAPKDGTHILATLPDSHTCYVIEWVDSKKGIRKEGVEDIGWHMVWDGYYFRQHEQPKYWMSLPDFP